MTASEPVTETSFLTTPDDVRSVINTLTDPIFLVDSARRIQLFNSAAEEQFGSRLLNLDFVHALRSPEALDCVDRVLSGAKSAEASIQLTLPVRMRLKISAVRPENTDKHGYSAVVTVTDISHIYEAEQMRSDFVANVSHELRSPLTTLTGIIETLKDSAKNDETARHNFLQIMGREAGRMNRLIEDLLSLSKVEAEAHVRPHELVDVSALLEQSVATFKSRAETDSPEIVIKPEGQIAPVPGDEDELTQVFHNLIENGVKYGSSGGKVEIKISSVDHAPGFRGPVVTISVRDHGPGIAAHHIPRLTERFYRIDEGRSREQGGTGLGLAIVKHIVNRHLGRLHIESGIGTGTTFTVQLPAD